MGAPSGRMFGSRVGDDPASGRAELVGKLIDGTICRPRRYPKKSLDVVRTTTTTTMMMMMTMSMTMSMTMTMTVTMIVDYR